MGERLAIGLLGGARLQQGGREIACPSRKAVALLAYLVLTGRAHMRRELGALFWGRGNESAARTSLRTALQRLPAQVRPHVLADRDTVAWRTASEIEIDALRFAEAARGDDIAALTVASDLYAGELLAGFDPDATPEFDDWLLQERARHQQLASGVFERLIVRHREAAQNDAAGSTAARRSALDVANRWLQLEPAAEGAHRWLMRLYLDLGRRDAAVAQFDLCKRALAVATGRSPSGETQALLEAAAAAGGAGVTAREARPAAASDAAIGVPGIAGTSFVGRIEDLAALDALLAEPACRLVTLHGLGGAGKTRLAHACLSRVAGRFAQGAGWVALEDVTSADAVPSAIARAVGLQLPQRGDPVEGLAAAFKHQERLLVLDNVEHLLAQHGQGPGLAELALALLQAAPRLRLLVTSREVLGVQEEWIYAVNGLAVPGSEDANPLGGAFGAVDLFVQRARQSYLGFSAQAEMPHVLRICRLVDGLPLAIELAAAWVRSVPCGDIARAVEEEITALASRHRDRPPRHASLEAVVAYSWRMLTPEQQTALAALSVFVGGFAQRAAREVADAPLHVLSALVDKALVARHPAGRLGMHPLVRQFAGDRLEQSCSAALQSRRRHAEFFAAEIVRWRARLDGPQEMDADAEIAADDANLLAAAEHWIAPGGPHDLNALAEPLMRLLFGRSMLRALPGWADKVLADDRLAPAPRALTLTYRGRAVAMLGQLDAGQANFDAAITLATEHRLDYPLGFALIYAVGIAHERDELALARQQLARVEPLLVRLGDAEIKLRARFVAAVVADAEGRLGDAHAMLGEALEIARTLGAPMFMATIQSQLAETHLHQGHTDSAWRHFASRSSCSNGLAVGRMWRAYRTCLR